MMLRAVLALVLLVPFAARAEVAIQKVTSPGGITAWLVQENSIPFVALNIAFEGGTSLESAEKRGGIHLMMALLEEGAGDRDARAFAEAREGLATSFGFDAFTDSVSVEAQFLTENRDASVALLRDALTNPRFDAAAIERVRAQVLAVIQGDANDANEIASATLADLAFPGHPYGSPLEGSAQTVAALTRDDIVQAHQDTLALDRIFVGVVGDISAEELGPMLDELLGGLPATGAAMPPETTYDLQGGVTVVDFPSPQSVVLFSQPGMHRADDDFLGLIVLNHIVGGSGFGSRLKDEVRVKRGLTYGIGSFPVSRDLAQQWMGQFSSSNAVVGEAIDVTRTIWADIAENGPTDAEVAAAITYITGAYPLRFDGNGRIASILTGMQMQDLPIDYIPGRNDKVRAVTADDVRRIAREVMDAEALHFVVVGQPQGVEATE